MGNSDFGPDYPVFADTPGGTIRARVEGAGDPAFLIHGISANRSTWDRLVPLLVGDHRVMAPDLLGRGASDPAPGADYRLETEVGRLVHVIRAADLRRPFLVGHSHGAALALGIARRLRGDPDFAASGLLLVNPVCPWTRRPAALGILRSDVVRRIGAALASLFRRPLTRYILGRRVYGDADVPAGTVERYAAPYGDRERALSLLGALRDWQPAELEGALEIGDLPAHVVTGRRDVRVPEADARRLAEALGCRFTVIETAGHAVPEESPECLAALLRGLE